MPKLKALEISTGHIAPKLLYNLKKAFDEGKQPNFVVVNHYKGILLWVPEENEQLTDNERTNLGPLFQKARELGNCELVFIDASGKKYNDLPNYDEEWIDLIGYDSFDDYYRNKT